MRQERTPEESQAIHRLQTALVSAGHIVVDDPSVIDRPDCAFELDGQRIGAECTYINLKQLMEWSGTHGWEDGKHYEVQFANEPHLWVRKAIEAKSGNVGTYKHRARSGEVWLILHSEFAPLPLFPCSPSDLALMRAAAAATPSEFDSVWYVHAEAGVNRLWRVGEPKETFPELDSPKTIRVRQGRVTLTPDRGEFSMGFHNKAETLVIPSLDPRSRRSELGTRS